MRKHLVVFDVDGTLVDSQAEILTAMSMAFENHGLDVPSRDAVLSIVGLSLPIALARLAPEHSATVQEALVESYKQAYAANRQAGATSPLYPGIREVLDALAQRSEIVLGVATGKSRRGLDGLIAHHGLAEYFVTLQVADDHPSKPHPSMLLAAMSEAGVAPYQTVMIGDTSYDIEMAINAKVASVGVSWGYHPREALGRASVVVDDVTDLTEVVDLALEGIC